MIKKVITFIISAIFISNIYFITATAEWNKLSDDTYEYILADGTKCTNGIYRIERIMYKFDNSGICTGTYTGWTKLKSDSSVKKYYKNGILQFDWTVIDDKYYFFDPSTAVFSGDIEDEIVKFADIGLTKKKSKYILNFTFNNVTNQYVTHSEKIDLEKLVDGKWEVLTLNENFSWIDDAVAEAPGISKEMSVNITDQYGKLENGTYRIKICDIIYSDSFELNFDKQ